MKFRKLKASEIDARVSTVTDSGCSLLLYKDARVDQNILDETVGCFNWQRSHQLIGDRLYCTVSIWDEDKKIWISKQDVGTESYTEKEKGQASDSFKRACFNFGIGRELYTAPFIWIPSNKVTLKDKNGKKTTNDRFEVEDIGYDKDGNINRLVIRNTTNKMIAYQMGASKTEEEKAQKKYDKIADELVGDTQVKSIRETIKKNPEKMTEEGICKYFNIKKLEEMKVSDLRTFLELVNGKEKAS